MNFGDERGVWRGTGGEPDKMAEAYERWNQEVKDTVPSERLLVWDPKEGWEPLCEFLEVPVPETPLPHVNDTENFQKNLIMGPAVGAINGGGSRMPRPRTRPRSARPGARRAAGGGPTSSAPYRRRWMNAATAPAGSGSQNETRR